MKAYKVEIEKLTFDWGRHDGWRLLGYYTNKDKAERTAKEAYENRNHIDTGRTRITEIEIDCSKSSQFLSAVLFVANQIGLKKIVAKDTYERKTLYTP